MNAVEHPRNRWFGGGFPIWRVSEKGYAGESICWSNVLDMSCAPYPSSLTDAKWVVLQL
jgi:hypothetical protein